MLHIVNGDSTGGSLRQAGVAGQVVSWAEALHEGPILEHATAEQWRQVRAHFYTECGWGTVRKNLAKLTRADEGLESYVEHDEVVLWFEHDLFDQLLLIRLLDWFASRPLGRTRLGLICIDRFPGFENFHGLGELRPDQLASLIDTRRPVDRAQLDLGREAWAAFRLPDPRALERLLGADTSALPFLAPALVRHFEEFPSSQNGLSRTESQILTTLVTAGPMQAAELFPANIQCERVFFMGDNSLKHVIESLNDGPRPAITLTSLSSHQPRTWACRAEITPTGRDLLACQADWVRIHGIDRWLGGVYLRGHEAAWRWDDFHRQLVAAPG
jgi:hypothetical protein